MAIAKPRSKAHRYVEELQEIVQGRFPDARFRVGPMPDTAEGIAIWTYTNAEFDEVAGLVSEREFQIMIDEGLFLYVIPMPLEALKG